jgi:hypothetical protein
MAAESLVILRLLGGLFGAGVVVHAFQRFRQRRMARSETVLRWLVGLSALLVCAFPDSVNALVAMAAMQRAAYGRMLVLLVLSSLLLWVLVLRERGKVDVLSRTLDRLIRVFALARGTPQQRERLDGTQIILSASAISWVESMMVVPCSLSSRISACNSTRDCTSSPAVGSSSSTTGGRWAIASTSA